MRGISRSSLQRPVYEVKNKRRCRVMEASFFGRHRDQLLELVLRHRLPTISGGRHFAAAGSLVAYGAFPRELCQHSAVLGDKILRGAQPANLPVERADKFYLAVILKTVEALDLTLSPLFLAKADEVIK